MRDVVLSLIVGALLLAVFKHPAISAYLWAWLSLMNPHKLTFGFAYSMPFAQLAAVAMLLAVLLSKNRYGLPWTPVSTLQIVLFAWMTITCFFAWNTREVILERWVFVAKIQIMIFATWMLLRGRKHIEVLIWVMALSIGFYGIKGGIFTLATGGAGRVWGPPGGMIQDNNALAAALVMILPMFVYLFQVATRQWVRAAVALCIVLIAFSILGSQSRGAFLALMVMAVFLGIKGAHPVRTLLALVVLLAIAVPFMPDSWFERMETVQTYTEDGSAMSRVYTWTTLWNAAVDNPITGVGFRADDIAIYDRYAPEGPQFEIFTKKVWVAHSIYLQMLGEHGFVGLGLFLLLFTVAWWRAGKLVRQARSLPEFVTWVPKLLPMVQVSLIGYAVGGAFLSLAYFDLPYYLLALIILVDATMRSHLVADGETPSGGRAGAGTKPTILVQRI